MRKYKFVDEQNFRFLCDGLTLDSRDLRVFDGALEGLDKKNQLPSRILSHNT